MYFSHQSAFSNNHINPRVEVVIPQSAVMCECRADELALIAHGLNNDRIQVVDLFFAGKASINKQRMVVGCRRATHFWAGTTPATLAMGDVLS